MSQIINPEEFNLDESELSSDYEKDISNLKGKNVKTEIFKNQSKYPKWSPDDV